MSPLIAVVDVERHITCQRLSSITSDGAPLSPSRIPFRTGLALLTSICFPCHRVDHTQLSGNPGDADTLVFWTLEQSSLKDSLPIHVHEKVVRGSPNPYSSISRVYAIYSPVQHDRKNSLER